VTVKNIMLVDELTAKQAVDELTEGDLTWFSLSRSEAGHVLFQLQK